MSTDGLPLWIPRPERVSNSQMDRFRRLVEQGHRVPFTRSEDLHDWSTSNIGAFWSAVWDHAEVIGQKGTVPFIAGHEMPDARFFPEALLSFAENLLHGRGAEGTDPAVIYRREDGTHRSISWEDLRDEVASLVAALRELGVGEGDRVAAWMPHVPETVVALLAANAIGAVFTSTSADFGVTGVVDRFGQIEPKVLLAADGYLYGGRRFERLEQLAEIRSQLPSVERVIVVGALLGLPEISQIPGALHYRQLIEDYKGAELTFAQLPFDHPVYILYSSGTTGKPKCIVHRAGGVLLKHLQEQQHQCDLRPGDRLFYFTTCGWMMWNWLVSGLGTGATIVLFDGNPFVPGPTALFDLVDEVGVTLMGVSAKYIDSVAKAGLEPARSHHLKTLRTITSTGSPLTAEGFRFVYEQVKADVHLASISGGTDLCGCFVGGDPTRPVYSGEIQGPALGMAMAVFDEDGRAVEGEPGELVCTEPFPSMPLRFWGEDGDDRYREAYFQRFPGVWTHGDYARTTDHGGYVILGRSDATLNSGGVRIGTAEIYRVVETFPEVLEAVAVGQEWENDTRMVLLVRLAAGKELGAELEGSIRRKLKEEESPRHVPALIVAIQDIPRTRSGKISELAVAAVINGRPVGNLEALANPESLEEYRLLSGALGH